VNPTTNAITVPTAAKTPELLHRREVADAEGQEPLRRRHGAERRRRGDGADRRERAGPRVRAVRGAPRLVDVHADHQRHRQQHRWEQRRDRVRRVPGPLVEAARPHDRGARDAERQEHAGGPPEERRQRRAEGHHRERQQDALVARDVRRDVVLLHGDAGEMELRSAVRLGRRERAERVDDPRAVLRVRRPIVQVDQEPGRAPVLRYEPAGQVGVAGDGRPCARAGVGRVPRRRQELARLGARVAVDELLDRREAPHAADAVEAGGRLRDPVDLPEARGVEEPRARQRQQELVAAGERGAELRVDRRLRRVGRRERRVVVLDPQVGGMEPEDGRHEGDDDQRDDPPAREEPAHQWRAAAGPSGPSSSTSDSSTSKASARMRRMFRRR
jgi:hypothetical protein